MKIYRVYYRNSGVIYKHTPFRLVKASSPAAALDAFRSAFPFYSAVSVFAD